MSFSFDKYLSEITSKSSASEPNNSLHSAVMDNSHPLSTQGSPKRDIPQAEENIAAAIAKSREDKSYEFNLDPTNKLKMCDLSLESGVKNGESKMSEAEYVFKALSGVPPDMRYKMIPSLVKNLMLKPYGDVRVSGCFSTPIMSVRCQPESRSTPPATDIENAAAQVLQANFQDAQPNTNIEGLVSTVLSLTQAFRNIEEISTNGDGNVGVSALAPDITDAISKQLDQITPQKESETAGDDKPKVWREGMDLLNKEDTSKTVFMSQDLNKRYDEKDTKNLRTSFDCAASKISREVSYFTKILEKAGADMKNTEYSLDPIRVLDARQKIKNNLNQLKFRIEEFISVNLEGDISDRPVETKMVAAAEIENVEYVYPPDKKATAKDQKIELSDAKNQTHICADCKEEIVVENGNLVEALQKHTHGKEGATGTSAATAEKKSGKEEAKQFDKMKRLMFVNKLVPCFIDDNLFTCLPCGDNLETDHATLLEHIDSNVHVQNLNKHNNRVQNDMILQNPEIFGPGKLINLTHLHIVMNKIFVDPMSKYAYCGLCRKELPPKQRNIDEHIESKSHNKFLLDSLEGNELSIGNPNSKTQSANQFSSVKTANMLDVASNPPIDVLELEKLLENKTRNRSDSETVRQDYFRTETHAFSISDKKYVCLYCDVYMDKNEIETHNQSSLHGSNVAISKYIRNGVTPLEQTLFRQNAIAVSYGVTSTYKCLCCVFQTTNKDVMLKNHINVSTHIQMLNAPPKYKERNVVNKNTYSRSPRVVLHKNGTEFWCHKCFVTISNVSLAFQHISYPGHEPNVDGVVSIGGMMFHCNSCMVKINGEKNVAQHVAGPKHRTANSDRNKTDYSNAEALKSQLPKTSRKNQADEKSKNQAQVNKQKKTKETENRAENRGKNTEDDESALLKKNGVLRLVSGKYECKFCNSGPKLRSEIFLHIFSYEHITFLAKVNNS